MAKSNKYLKNLEEKKNSLNYSEEQIKEELIHEDFCKCLDNIECPACDYEEKIEQREILIEKEIEFGQLNDSLWSLIDQASDLEQRGDLSAANLLYSIVSEKEQLNYIWYQFWEDWKVSNTCSSRIILVEKITETVNDYSKKFPEHKEICRRIVLWIHFWENKDASNGDKKDELLMQLESPFLKLQELYETGKHL